MDNIEVALNITLKALECGYIRSCEAETAEKANAENAKQISDFYTSVLKTIGNPWKQE